MSGKKSTKPTTIEEAVAELRSAFPESELQAWAAQPEEDALLLAHFGLGMWIRNSWVHGGGSPLATRSANAGWPYHDDTVSSVILKALWRVLNGATL